MDPLASGSGATTNSQPLSDRSRAVANAAASSSNAIVVDGANPSSSSTVANRRVPFGSVSVQWWLPKPSGVYWIVVASKPHPSRTADRSCSSSMAAGRVSISGTYDAGPRRGVRNAGNWQTPDVARPNPTRAAPPAGRSTRRRAGAFVMVVLAGALAVGCDSSGSGAAATGRDPVEAARGFCSRDGQREIATSLGVEPTRVTKARLADHTYSCRYLYPTGRIALSVTGFPTRAAATSYANSLSRSRGRQPEPPGFGEDIRAFVTTDGSLVVRKNADVLVVDVSALAPTFGVPPQSPKVIAVAVAVTILGHWSPG